MGRGGVNLATLGAVLVAVADTGRPSWRLLWIPEASLTDMEEAMFQIISGAIPNTLGDAITLNFDLPTDPDPVGILFYMVDTRRGDHTYRILMNGKSQSKIALPRGNNFATLHTDVSDLRLSNVLAFESDGGPPVNILNVVLFWASPVIF
jgi:hypothetical protein